MAAAPRRLLVAAFVLLALQQAAVNAQETTNGQGKILWAMGQWLSGSPEAAPLAAMGWTDGGNPCKGWQGVSCNGEGFVTGIFLNGKNLAGSIPSDPGLWVGLTGLTNLDLANNQLSGSVPAAIKSAPVLTSVNLAENSKVCGFLPTDLPANTQGTTIGSECVPPAPPATPAASPSPSPEPAPSPPAANTTAPAASPPAEAPAAVAPPAPPAPLPTLISSAPICSCALRGFGSQDCTGALANVCRRASPPEVCASRSNLVNDTAAATALGVYLADTCFKGQNMDTSICTCVQNLLGNDCAKARVSLCVKGDPLCLPIQDVVSESSSAGAPDAAQQVVSAFDAQCNVAEPTQPGVKATMEFPELSMGQYISKQYTQNVANALSSVTNVPTSSISTLDVRPFTGVARSTSAQPPKRLLLQQAAAAAGNGVQATYFLATDDPNAASQRLSAAANDGTLSTRLAQYGINSQAGGLRVQNYLQPPAPSTAGAFPLWALAPIIVGGLLLLALLCLSVWWCCLRKKSRGTKASAYAPGSAKQSSSFNKAAGSFGPSNKNSSSDVAVPRDMPPKDFYNSPGYAGAAAGGYSPYSAGTAAPATYKAPTSQTVVVYDTPPAGNNTMTRGAGAAAGAAAVGAMAAGTAAAVKRSSSNNRPPSRPESPNLSNRHASSNPAHLSGIAAAAGGASAGSNTTHLSTLQSLKARGVDYIEPIARSSSGGSAGSSTLTPWEAAAAAARPGAGSDGSSQPKGAAISPAASGVTGGSMRSTGVGAGAAGAAGLATGSAGAAAAAMGPRSGSLAPASSSELAAQGSSSTTGWKSNVRPTSGRMPAAGAAGGSSMLANPAGKGTQQAERAKFWAQFQETWQQVRQTQNVNDNEPGSPSSGTNWTDITDARTFRQQN